MKTTKIQPKLTLPKVVRNLAQNRTTEKFPLDHYSYSTFVRFSTNPIMFKINYLNGDVIDTTRGIAGVIGQAFHLAMEYYYTSVAINGESEAVRGALEAGMEFLDGYDEGFIEFSSTVPNKQKAQEIFAFAVNAYVTETNHDDGEELVACEEKLEHEIDVDWRGERLVLPVRLKGYLDKVVRKDGKIKIVDYKTTRAFSDPEKIDGAKIIQAVQYYLLAYAEYGEAPHSIVYEEVKTTRNRDRSPQVRRYEVVFSQNEQFFDFYFRLYDDMTRAINGEAVFVPNIHTIFDNEVSIIAYINRLDVSEEAARMMKKLRVETITDLLKKKIESAGNMRKFLRTAEKKFVSAKSLNYNSMTNEEKIRTKLMEHGMLVQFESKVDGHSVDLYRFNPSIGLKMSKLTGYVADIEQVVGVSGVRVLAPIPNTSLIGFEVPREHRTFPEGNPGPEGFRLAMGVDIMGGVYRFDIRKAPHMLIAGATGSGKSVFLNSILSQLCLVPDVELHLFDPKIVELSRFSSDAKEYYPDPESIYLALDALVHEMNDRYKALSRAGARNIDEYNLMGGRMAYKVVVVDEFGDLAVGNHVLEEEVKTGEVFTRGARAGEEKVRVEKLNLSKEIIRSILILAQKARAAGIHLIVATQRPSTDIITGSIKANFPTKVAFRTAKAVDSQVLLDEAGAEKLLGKGDMIFSSDDGQIRLQGFSC
jgi:hypothetical protein